MLQSLGTSGQRYSGKVVQGRGGAEGNFIHYKCGTQPESHCCCRRSRVSRNYVRSVLCSTIPQCCNLACPQTFLVTCVTIPNLVIHEHTKARESQNIAQGHPGELGNRDLLVPQKCINRWCSNCGDHVCKQVGGV